jgi:hypothetical protein
MDYQCEICLENKSNVDAIQFCSEEDHNGNSNCTNCTIAYITNKIETSFLGSCPTIFCPSSSHLDGKKKILDFRQWKNLLSPGDLKKYHSLADSLLAFLCGGCHSLKSLQINSTQEQLKIAKGIVKNKVETMGGTELYDSFIRDLNFFVLGDIIVEQFYAKLRDEYFPTSMISESDQEVWEVFKNILRLIQDPERRANLHLRHLRSRPRIWTPCCHREHCFRCRTKDFHEGISCDENTSGLDSFIISCPSCCVAIAKGDGCNTVTCVCGKQFSWTLEKENIHRSAEFFSKYPLDTSISCAQILFETHPEELMILAKAWQLRNTVSISQALLKIWISKFPQCPSQACVVLPLDALPGIICVYISIYIYIYLYIHIYIYLFISIYVYI